MGAKGVLMPDGSVSWGSTGERQGGRVIDEDDLDTAPEFIALARADRKRELAAERDALLEKIERRFVAALMADDAAGQTEAKAARAKLMAVDVDAELDGAPASASGVKAHDPADFKTERDR